MNRIDKKFIQLKRNKKKAFISFITAGDPNLKATHDLVLAFEKAGVDIIELGVPFSDPMADGPTIQASSQRSLDKGTTLVKVFDLVKSLRKQTDIPIALMMYYNPIFHMGEKEFVARAISSGVDGVIVPDLPPEEAGSFIKLCRKSNISTVFFLAPTTTKERMKKIIQASSGFVYYISLTGVTGARKSAPTQYLSQAKIAKKLTSKPVCIGFGISTPEQVREMSKFADGVIVGSAIVKEIEKNRGSKTLVSNVARFVGQLTKVMA